jgi:hypothetical protein
VCMCVCFYFGLLRFALRFLLVLPMPTIHISFHLIHVHVHVLNTDPTPITTLLPPLSPPSVPLMASFLLLLLLRRAQDTIYTIPYTLAAAHPGII